MVMKRILVFSLLLGICPTYSFSQELQLSCACCTAVHKQFNFWLGEWNVYDTTGNKVGENSIIQREKNCVLNERWTSASGSTGSSYNYYDRSDSTWNQVWVDSRGGNLVLKGRAMENQMILKSTLQKTPTGGAYFNRITWTLNEDGSVSQLWEILNANNEVTSVAFLGIYKRKK